MLTDLKIKQLIKEKPLLLFVIAGCPWCKKARDLLKPYHPRVVVVKPEERALLNRISGMHTVPQVFLHGRLLGGYTETYAYLQHRGAL